MQPGNLPLTPGQAAQFLGSDGRLEVDVPTNAVTAADLSEAGGSLSLLITQIAPASGSSAGGSGQISLGTYLIQLINLHDQRLTHGLHAPLTLLYHYGAAEGAFDLVHLVVVLNTTLPEGVHLVAGAGASDPGLGTRATQHATLDSTHHSLSASLLLGSAASVSWNTDSPVASFGKPDIFNADLSAGALSAGYPIDVPAGPGGFTPPVTLSYSSAGVSENHSPQGAASWVGEGWNMTSGSISWAEHNVAAGCTSPCSPNWQDSWQLSDPFGTSAELIPPNLNVSTYYDDTGNGITASPIYWHTSPESHAKIISYVGPLTIPGMTNNPPCFRVFLPNGIMEEFGCTADSLQYYIEPSGTNAGKAYISNWLLDLVIDREGNQIHYTYQSDLTTGYGGASYPRDTVLSIIEWDSPDCYHAPGDPNPVNALNTACTPGGTRPNKWAPLVRVSFAATHGPARLTALLPGICNTGQNLRCDDPLDLSGSGGMAAPQVQSTWILNDILVQVRTSGTGAWNTLRDYQLGYEEGGPKTITDPQSGQQESTAGILDLTQLSVVGDDGATLEPVRFFTHTTLTEHYEDDALPHPTGNCGPSWNTGCLMWSQSYGGNSRYLASVSNGMGLLQTYTWAEGRNNTMGVVGGGTNALDPLYCNDPTRQSQSPCNQADDQNWSHAVLTQMTSQVIRLTQQGQGGQQTSTPVTSTTAYTYRLSTYSANPCSTCLQGMYWGNQSDADYLDFYNGKFMGFAQATVSHPDGSREVHKYFATEGWGSYNISKVTCYSSNPCHNDPWWDYTNELHGHEYLADYFDTNGTTALKEVQTQYATNTCPPSGVSGTPSTPPYGDFDGKLVSELDPRNPVAACDIQTTQVDTYILDGQSTTGNNAHQTVTYTYDSYGRQTSQTTTSNDGGAMGSPTTIVAKMSYLWNDAVNATSTSASGVYLINFVAFTDVEDSSGNRYSCTYTHYDGMGWNQGSLSSFTGAGKVTTTRSYANCGTQANNFNDATGLIQTTYTYDQWGNQLTTTDPDANANPVIPGHTGCTPTGSSGTYTTCTNYDTTFETLPISAANALNQTTSTGFTQTAAGGFGLWPTSTTDANGQVTTIAYDGLGRAISQTLPGETTGLTTTTTSYTVWCLPGSAQSPCVEVDQTQRLDSSHTVVTRAFYDGYGRLVELRAPGPPGQDVVRFRYYDPSGRDIFESIQYLVAAYTGAPGSAAYSLPDSNQPGTSTTYDGMGRQTSTTDPVSTSDITHVSYSIACAVVSGDSACYEQTLVKDPLNHQSATLADALGRENYDLRYTGNGSYTLYATTKYKYDYTGNLVQITHPGDTATTTFQYDMAGHQTGLTDPDRGTLSNVYDPNGNLVQTTDARGAGGTIYAGYDGLNRPTLRSINQDKSSPYVTYTYDSTANGNHGVGRVTGETFVGGPSNSLTGSYSYVYDVRGQQTSKTLAVGSTSYPFQMTYDDAGNILTETYPTGEVVTNAYTGGWFTGLSQQQNSINTTLLSNVSYTGIGGAGHLITSAALGGVYQYTATYDQLLQPTDLQYMRISDGATLFREQRSFDFARNISSVTTTLPQGTDVQQFCYDEQNRLTWAGSVGTPPCTGTAITPGTLTSAQYTQNFTYDNLGRLTSGPLGTYTYGSSAHLHAVTSIGSTYSANYDAAGNETCRSPVSSTTCTGTPAGAALSYDAEGRLSHWQNVPTSPTTTDNFLYDGEGTRVEQQVTQGSTTTTTVYVGGFEEVSTRGSTTNTTTYYYAGTMRVALAVNGVFSYLTTNGLGSVSVALSTGGTAQASTLYLPYGGGRYSNGTMPGSYGYTGQQADGTTGLDYYAARYYDPLAGQFVSADTVLPGNGFDPWGLSRYAYVEGNPVERTDPTGHKPCSLGVEDCRGQSEGNSLAGESCADHFDQCKNIITTFQDWRTRIVLIDMLTSDMGSKVVEFLLKFAEHIHGIFDGDDLIQWDLPASDAAGARNDGAFIHLKGTLFDPSDHSSIGTFAGEIAHEAVEVYFEQADHINGGTLPIDYVAEWIAGTVQVEMGIGGQAPSSRGMKYEEWLASPDGQKYASPKNDGGYGEPSDPDTRWGFWGIGGEKSDTNFLGNPMGLSLDMLRWENSNKNWSLQDWYNNH
jgi:RHS repeat-associated protein